MKYFNVGAPHERRPAFVVAAKSSYVLRELQPTGGACRADPDRLRCPVPNQGLIRFQLNGPKASVPLAALASGSIVSFSHSSGVVLPCTVTRRKLGTL